MKLHPTHSVSWFIRNGLHTNAGNAGIAQKFPIKHMVVLGGVAGGLAGSLGPVIWRSHGWLGVLTQVLAIACLIILGMWFFSKLEPLNNVKDGTPGAGKLLE